MSTRDDVIDREQAWRAKQGPDVAKRYRFLIPSTAAYRQCSWHIVDPELAVRFECGRPAIWRVARSPFSRYGASYFCELDYPEDVPEGTP